MSRTINEIQFIILTSKANAESLGSLEVLTDNEKSTLVNLTSTSRVAIWRLWVYIMSVGIWTLEKLFDTHTTEINDLIALNKIHNFDWYIAESKAFQFGFTLNKFGVYDSENVDESLIIASKIIKQVAIIPNAEKLQIKLAKEESDELVKLTDTELAAFSTYISRRKDAGTSLIIMSRDADDFKTEMDIYYDPQILNSLGQRIDGTNDTPVLSKIQEFSKELEFNGEVILTKLTDFLQTIEGVIIPKIKTAHSKFGANDYVIVDEKFIPDSGYFKLDEANTVIIYKTV